jgi:hypothetical protein
MSGFVFKFGYYTSFIFRKFDRREYISPGCKAANTGNTVISDNRPVRKKRFISTPDRVAINFVGGRID